MVLKFHSLHQKIKNPNYKAKWKTPWIDNPGMILTIFAMKSYFKTQPKNMNNISFLFTEFEDEPDLYVLKPIKYVGIEVWQVGT